MIKRQFADIINKIFADKIPDKIAIGVSGGIDSMALLFLLKNLLKSNKIKIFACIVDHKFRENSNKEANLLKEQLEKKGINAIILESIITDFDSNIESQLRQVRYNLLNKFCLEHGIKHLFIAHHNQDLAENFLIRLFRGSGIDGLAALDYITDFRDIKIVRPLLDFKKEDLKQYLITENISWFEDESNQDEKFLRNKIRHFLESLPNQDLINQRVALASKSILENKKIINNNLKKNRPQILNFNDLGYILLKKRQFCQLTAEEGRKYLAYSLMEVSGNYYKPRLKKLENLYFKIVKEKKLVKSSFYGCIIEEFNDNEIIIYREKSKIKTEKLENNIIWDNRFKIKYIGDKDVINIVNIAAKELNKLDFKHDFRGKIKNIIYTLPVFKRNSEIIAIPHLDFFTDLQLKDQIIVNFDKKTPIFT